MPPSAQMQFIESGLNQVATVTDPATPSRLWRSIQDAWRPAAPVLAMALKLLVKATLGLLVVVPLAVVLTVFSIFVARGLGVPVLGNTPNTELFRR
jgi:hypothetical protein